MEIFVDRESDVPIHQQLVDQIAFLIATQKLKSGSFLPSVRELARRLRIHHNTVSQAYSDLTERKWLLRHRGRRLIVGAGQHVPSLEAARELDDLINATIRFARQKGHSLQALRQRVRERLLEQPADHVLVVEQDAGLRRLMQEEIRVAAACGVEGCSREELAAAPGLGIGALVVTPQYSLARVDQLVPKNRPVIGVTFATADEHIQRIRNLKAPSVVGVVSVSEAFLQTARSLLAPAIGQRHSLHEVLLSKPAKARPRGLDVVFCDSIAHGSLAVSNAVHYRLLDYESLDYISNAFGRS
jgi:DNA-binding transcriptional regulator YhcF (GntR family)